MTTPMRVRQLAAEGDRYFLDAMVHFDGSDPSLNAKWTVENRAAMELFRQSRDSYVLAHDEYKEGKHPPSQLLDRLREAQMRLYTCRKRAANERK